MAERMGEQQIQKKRVSRAFAITPREIFIIFAVGLFGAICLYSYVRALSQISSQIQQISQLESEISSKNSQIQTLTDQKNELQKIVDLQEGTVFVDSQTVSQPASSYSNWVYSASYAGYIEVIVESSTTSNTYARVTYFSSHGHGVSYDTTIVVGTTGIASFPILPATQILIRVGNSNLVDGATETVSIVTYP